MKQHSAALLPAEPPRPRERSDRTAVQGACIGRRKDPGAGTGAVSTALRTKNWERQVWPKTF